MLDKDKNQGYFQPARFGEIVFQIDIGDLLFMKCKKIGVSTDILKADDIVRRIAKTYNNNARRKI